MLSFFALHLIGCTQEARVNEGEVDEGEVSLRFEVRLPADASRNSITRGMTAEEEIVVSTTDVYHFVDINNDGTYLGVTAAPIPGTFTDGSEELISITLDTYPGKKSRLVFVLNARQSGNYGYYMHRELDDFLSDLLLEQPAEWNSIRGACDPLPMYGITCDVEIKKDIPGNRLTDSGNPFPLIRTHAKFNVSLCDELSASGEFRLESVCVFNRKTHGNIAYHENLWDPAHVTGPCVTAPHIPSNCGNVYEPAAPYFTVCTDNGRSDYGQIVNKQYALEADNASEKDRLKKTALIIGGYYGTDTDITYYRLDIDVTDGNILRNHLYDVEIQSVAGSGSDTAKEAFEGVSDLSAKIVAWNLADRNTIIDGQFLFEISHDEIICTAKETNTLVTFSTTYNISDRGYPPGIQIVEDDIIFSTESRGWINLLEMIFQGGNGDPYREIFIIVSDNTMGVDRWAKIPVSAGNMTKYINIYQEK